MMQSASRLKGASLQRRMTAMLLAIVLQSILLTGVIIIVGSVYLSNFSTIMNDCYDINQLLLAYTAELSTYEAFVLRADELDQSRHEQAQAACAQALRQVDIAYAKSQEQYLLLQSVRSSYDTFRAACAQTITLRLTGGGYADAYGRSLRIGQYIEGYIKQLLQAAISEGQDLYRVNMLRFRYLPVLFILSVLLSLVSIVIWTRWMVKRVVTPINELIHAAGAMSENQYDTPDIPIYQEGEIAQLARVVNEMKHSTARLVDSLRTQREIESRLHAEEMRRVQVDAAMDTLRLSLLQSQINPHFLFNTLNIISRMAQLEGAPSTEDLIVRLANLFRYNLQSADETVPLSSELRIVQDYIAIQQIRFGSRIDFALRCDVNPNDYQVPVFTMQPLIENAVIHGISPMEAGGRVAVDIRREEDSLSIVVEDTGVGMSAEQVQALLSGDGLHRTHVSGLGIGNVRKRVEARCPGSSFTIDSRVGQGTRIAITIPLKEEGYV